MTKRKIKKAIKRLRKLPRGTAFFQYLSNKGKHFWMKASKSTKVAQPSTIMLELSAHCNIHCTVCPREYDYGKKMDQGFMDKEMAMKVIDENWAYLDSIGLTGMGETFLYRDIEEIVDYIRSKNKGIVISVSTNACAPKTLEYAGVLKDKIDTVQVSIDGLHETYNRIRIGSEFEKFSQNLKALSEMLKGSQTDLMLNMVVTKENYHQMAGMTSFAHEMGIPFLNFTLFNLASVTGIEKEYYDFYVSEEFLKARKELEAAKAGYPSVEVTFWDHNKKNGFRNCPFPWTHFYICWNGEVAPCCAKPFPKEMSFGNAFEKPLMEILNNEKYRNFRKMWFNNQTHPFCRKCHFIDLPRADQISNQ